MAAKSRYMAYFNALTGRNKTVEGKVSTKESVLGKLKSLREKEFVMTVPIAQGEVDEA